MYYIFSNHHITLKRNNNLVLYGSDGKVLWESNTANKGTSSGHLQLDNKGKLRLYDGDGDLIKTIKD